MKKIFVGLVALATFYVVHGTTGGKGVLYPFPISAQLTCYVEDGIGDDGKPAFAPEETPTIPFGYRTMQNGQRVYLPFNSSVAVPSLRGLTAEVQADLLTFLGSDYNQVLTSTSRPVRDAPRACDLFPAEEGSAGALKQHAEVVEEPIDVFTERQDSDTWTELTNNPGIDFGGGVIIGREDNDPTTRTDIWPSEDQFTGFNFRNFYRQYINNIDEMCELWIAKCPLTTIWAELPPSFFPRYFAQGTCSGKNCSYPRGLFCEEDFTYRIPVTVLRWDCCYNPLLDIKESKAELRWDCGWRKVQIQILCECTCACGPVYT